MTALEDRKGLGAAADLGLGACIAPSPKPAPTLADQVLRASDHRPKSAAQRHEMHGLPCKKTIDTRSTGLRTGF
jgi:hypothetical protein